MLIVGAPPKIYKNVNVYKRFKWNDLNKRIYKKVQNFGKSPNEIMHNFKIGNVSRLATSY